MNFLDNIKEKTIIVCPSNIKSKVLNEINKRNYLINVKIYSLEELKKIVYFDYDIRAVLYLMDKYNYTCDVAKYYLNNIYYVEDKTYNIEKLDYLVKIKKELIDNDLLIYNKLFIKAYKNTKFIVFGYDYIDSFNKKLLSNFDYEIIEEKEFNRVNEVFKFNTLEDEVLFVINKIINLLNNNININNIYLLNIDSNYQNEIIRLFDMFNIPIDISNNSSIISTIIGNKVFNYLESSKSFEKTIEYMDSLNMKDNKIYNSIINIFNKYVDLEYSFDNILNCIKYDFENTKLNSKTLKNAVRVGDLYNSCYDEDDYIFLLGFNQGSLPKVFKDEDYISDDLKEILGLDSTNEINIKRIKSTKDRINKIKNIIISYKKYYMAEEFYPSNLLSEDCFTENKSNDLSTENSRIYSDIKFAKMIDNLINYDQKNKELPLYNNSLNIRYMEYDNKYKMIDKELLKEYLKNYLSLSYSSIDSYFKCQFRFFVNSVLKLNKYEDSFEIFIGNLFHYVLSKSKNDDFDFEKEYNDYLKDKEFSNKELFYLDKLKKELLFLCDFLKEFNKETKLNNILTEKEIPIDKSIDDIKVIFKGYVDKIMYKEIDNKTLVSIIDYKTGNTKIKLDYAKEGIGLQLFVYLYLISKKELFDNPYFVGFYLQNIISEIKTDPKKSYLEQKIDSFKLHGYSTSDKDYLEIFDPTYIQSKYIASMSTIKSGELSSKAKVIDENTMLRIVDFIDKKVEEARDNVLDGDFLINPKYYYGDKEVIGCYGCKFKDLCFRKDDNIVKLNKNNSFEFLEEGDIDA